jgi:capsular polysaccharide transport system permease protein
LLPVAALAWFWFSAVPNRYLSQAEVLIKHSAPASAELKLNLLAPLGNDSARQDAYSIREFILSERMLRELDSRFDLVQRYQQNALETRLPLDGEAPVREDMLDYYRRLITVRYDENTALITVQAQDFSPVLAQQLLRYILMRSERFMNNLSNQIAGNQVAFAQAEVERAKKKLETAAQRVQQFQDRTGVLNPSAPVEGVHALVAQMQSELAQETLALQKYRSYLTDASPRVQASLTTVASLKAMIANEQQKLAGPGPSASGKLNHVAQDFEKLKFDLEFWKQNYEVALKALETARTEAARQLKFLVLVTPPSRPERSEAPNRWYLLALAAVASGLMVGTLRLVWGTIQDHRI